MCNPLKSLPKRRRSIEHVPVFVETFAGNEVDVLDDLVFGKITPESDVLVAISLFLEHLLL